VSKPDGQRGGCELALEQRLPIDRHASENTRDSYAYAFQLLLTFAGKRLQVTPSQLAVGSHR
jgi:integrase/recombinase XerD